MKRFVLILLLACATAGLMDAQSRQIHAICEDWEFRLGPLEGGVESERSQTGWQTVSLPHTWNAKDMNETARSFYEGEGWYKKNLYFSDSQKGRRFFLRFEGVGSCAKVYLNGILAGTHKGAYSAFVCEITRLIRWDAENELLVQADNTSRPDVIPVNHYLFGVYGGIYRPVWLISTDPCCITVNDFASPGVSIRQKDVSSTNATVTVCVKYENRSLSPLPAKLETVLVDQEGRTIKSRALDVTVSPQGVQRQNFEFKIHKPHLWQGREDPYLYRVVCRLKDRKGQVLDAVEQPLGIRDCCIKPGEGFFLNGKKYPMYGVARHQDREGVGSALQNWQHDEDLDAIMEVGATTIRLAHYQQSEYFYSRCDSLGLLVWAEIPFVNRVTGQEWENAHQQMKELIRQNINHPSIFVWGIHNEVYKPYDYTIALTRSLHDLCKSEDPDRFTGSVNGYGHADHPVNFNADIQGINRYFGWYERKLDDFIPWIEQLEQEEPWMRMMLTEYGADGNPGQQTEFTGESLDWGKVFYPETFQTKTHERHWSYIAAHPFITASYVWNMFDFSAPMWSRGGVPARNQKGLITFDRQLKKDAFYWYKANWSKEPVVYLTQRRNTIRETRRTSITVYSNVGWPKVNLNGKELEGIRQGGTPVHYIIDNVILDEGLNVITAECAGFQDRIEWYFNGETSRQQACHFYSEEHGGWLEK